MQQVSCICLLYLSAAYSRPLHPTPSSFYLIWHFLCLSAMVNFISLISHIDVVIPPHTSPSSPLTCGDPQGSVLCSVFFNLYTTPLSYLISALSISHLLYADDTQLFISFVPKNFSSAINNLQFTITLISSWMSVTILLSIPLKLNSFSSVSLSKSLK